MTIRTYTYYLIFVSTLILLNNVHCLCMNIDSLYQKARYESFNGDKTKAEQICKIILEENESNHDARLLYGQLLAWRKEYDKSMKQLEIIINKVPDYIDAYNILTDVAFWAGDNEYALSIVEKGLFSNPDNFDLRYRKVRSLYHVGKLTEANDLAITLLKEKSDHTGLIQLHESIISSEKLKKILCEYKLTDKLKSGGDKRHSLTLEYLHPLKPGDIVFRINTASKFGRRGIQFESDLYPKIGRNGYLCINLGYSPSELFPGFRSAIDIFYSSALHFEISGGVCYIYFDKSIWVYNISVANRIRQFYSALKGILTPHRNADSPSLTLNTKFKYFFNKSSDFDFCELRSEIGKSPNELDIKYSKETIRFDKNISGTLLFQKKIGGFLLLGVGAQYLIYNNVYRNIAEGYLTVMFKTGMLIKSLNNNAIYK